MPWASDEPTPIEDLLEQLLTGEGGDRSRAFIRAIQQGVADVTVADYCCGSSLTDPLVMTFRQLCRHVFSQDHPTRVATRGHRTHTPVNVVLWHEELGGHGPAFARGGGS